MERGGKSQMKSASLFVCQSNLPASFRLSNQNYETVEVVNDVEEVLRTQLFVNEETPNGYIHCHIVADELMDIRARVLNTNINQIIIQNPYDIYFHRTSGNLIAFSGKRIAERAKEIFQQKFSLEYQNHEYNIDEIIANAVNVKGARFKDLTIQTLRGGMLRGNMVDRTELYELMLHNGTLSTTNVIYPFGSSEVSFSVSTTGSLVLFSNLDDVEYLELLEDLSSL